MNTPVEVGAGTRARRRPGSRPVATVVVLLGAGVAVLAAGRPWATTAIAGLPGSDAVTADGRSVAPGAPALALVAAAGAIVLATSGRVVRLVVAGLLVLAGAGILAASLPIIADPGGALGPAVAKATGTAGAPGGVTAGLTGWPTMSVVGGLLVAAGGVLGLVRGRGWSQPSRRFERGTEPEGRTATDERRDAWDRLSAGEDPTDQAGTEGCLGPAQ